MGFAGRLPRSVKQDHGEDLSQALLGEGFKRRAEEWLICRDPKDGWWRLYDLPVDVALNPERGQWSIRPMRVAGHERLLLLRFRQAEPGKRKTQASQFKPPLLNARIAC